ncbi:hypothetical protein MLD38_021831 [Melastoma candidum]|uniref:Uncharacterized protein n=1 Tax=Melastoma candidum TaxID=119954 RepID=A0ACB9QQF6_9MYRT|nr:hypothetical protein MLD38_021831 [Melastoma candidum]
MPPINNRWQPSALTPMTTMSSVESEYPAETSTNYCCLNTLNFNQLTLQFASSASYIASVALFGDILLAGSSSELILSFDRSALLAEEAEVARLLNASFSSSGKAGAVKSLAALPDRGILFSAHQDRKIRVWRDRPGDEGLSRIATMPTLADRTLGFLSPRRDRVRRHVTSTWVCHADAISALALSGDGMFLYSVSWDRSMKIWRTSDFKCLESMANAHNDAINAVVASYGGEVYTGSSDGMIKQWRKNKDDNKHAVAVTLESHRSAGVNALAMSRDESILYSGGSDGVISSWRIDYGETELNSTLTGHGSSVLCLGTTSSNLLASGSADKTIRVWRSGVSHCTNGRFAKVMHTCVRVLEGHGGPIKCLVAATVVDEGGADDATHVVVYSGGLDSELKVWRVSVPTTS